MKLDLSFEQNQQNINVPFSESGGQISTDFGETSVIHDGQNGATFIPSVSAEGIISWTNDRELPNPAPVNIKGEKGDRGERGERGLQGVRGDTGEAGKDGVDGKDGYTPIKGVDYFDGKDGTNGVDGKDGKNGTSVTHAWVGTTLKITSASGTSAVDLKGDRGAQGEDGYTPKKGVDYFTPADKNELIDAVISALPKYAGEVTAV